MSGGRVERVAPVAVGAGVATAIAVAGTALVRRRLEAGARMLNERLPVHSRYWRERAKEPGDLVYVALGDSAAQGIGASRPERGWVGLVARRIRFRTSRSVRVVNLSVSGATVAAAVAEQLPRLAKRAPDVVTVAVGANDIGPGFDEVAFEREMAHLLDAVPPTALVADLPFFYLPSNERRVERANGIVRRLARERGLAVVPLHASTGDMGWRGVVSRFAADMFHPNDRGHRAWADAFLPALDADLAARFPRASRSRDSRGERSRPDAADTAGRGSDADAGAEAPRRPADDARRRER